MESILKESYKNTHQIFKEKIEKMCSSIKQMMIITFQDHFSSI